MNRPQVAYFLSGALVYFLSGAPRRIPTSARADGSSMLGCGSPCRMASCRDERKHFCGTPSRCPSTSALMSQPNSWPAWTTPKPSIRTTSKPLGLLKLSGEPAARCPGNLRAFPGRTCDAVRKRTAPEVNPQVRFEDEAGAE